MAEASCSLRRRYSSASFSAWSPKLHGTTAPTTGWRGVMEKASGSPNPEKFPFTPGLRFPVFEALSHIAGHCQAALAPAVVTNEVVALGLFQEAELSRILAANLSALARTVRLVVPGADERCLQLKPYEVICLKLGDQK